ncbi:hypothetical protein K6V92_10240 [Cupriavidus respiraculi]|uniref:hypothetical protein n=1 Tax=Cupriavidus respiraculi TaxID=195930 RepID=UPI001C958FD2|nr:hypothetical protein [Cupriavidus respiraculi]MBY4946997.1 hypothetical protein [Cupriavidus respiraculi]
MSGNSNSGQQTTRVELPGYVAPYASQLMERAHGLSWEDVPQYGGQRTAGLNSDHYAALDAIRNRALNGSADINAARGNLAATMQGQYFKPAEVNPYAGANPYLDQAIQKTQGDIAKSYATGTGAQTMAQFRNAGAFGGSAMMEQQDMQNRALGDSLSNASSSMRMQDYGNQQQLAESRAARGDQLWNAERQRQIQGMMFAPQLANTDYQNYQALLGAGDITREAQQSALNDDYARWQDWVNAPYQQLETLSNAIMGATGGGVARNTVSPGVQTNRTAGAIGGALSGAGMGSMFGPWGTAIGGGLGLLGGLFG